MSISSLLRPLKYEGHKGFTVNISVQSGIELSEVESIHIEGAATVIGVINILDTGIIDQINIALDGTTFNIPFTSHKSLS